ncbi:maleate cis-trans isomerase family protein [Cupriavidus oxalaticus]|uniref:Maleate isomerase n=1 Tax=Cupriavidus oxalaticus TaxID=96344 RepID=A0A375GFN4_9BURK|nr:Asp/Glu racemase [Cupriavidus oxalaticus]QEZ44340.1 Asp/Glu racemase [Cupriavidus oxalaticus]QRQ84297.1 Asp/Glu racemase [Cupriavidus oxalaticus]QRQ91616.1 Asp/Glu racemase [Cupriavidus oxalaticus]WQD86189.1 Asp/Glu racemase [Cupriavidus oxalaticus]SPC05100.1 Maleate isomerase [Cupriavidus oxalaticus]
MQYRIGQIVPSSNITMEREVPAIFAGRMQVLPERFSFHSSRVRMHRVVAEELEKMNRDMGRCAQELADARVDIMSTACLVATMCMGKGYHRQVIEDLNAAIDGVPYQPAIMTSAGALVEELKDFGAKRIVLLAPYSDALTKTVVEYIESEGIAVKDAINFSILDNLDVGARDPMQLLEDVKRLDTAGVDVVVLSACVQMPSLPAIEQAQLALGLPVTSTAVCTARQMMRRLGIRAEAPNAGALLGSKAGLA